MRIGIIGSGFGLYGLLPAFNSIPECEVVCICGKKTERLTGYCASIGLTNIYSDWQEMLESETIDALAIAVIPSAQYEIAKFAMQKGIHIFAEKPLTATLAQAVELMSLAEKYKIVTAVDFIFPEIPEWQKVKELLDGKVYGELKHITVRWDFLSYDIKNSIASWKTDSSQGGGALAFYGSHTLYYIEYFCGAIDTVTSKFGYSTLSKNGAEVEVTLDITFANGVTGDVHVSCNTPDTNIHTLTFVCEQATLVLESTEGVTEHFSLTAKTEQGNQSILCKDVNNIKSEEDERVKTVRRLASRFIDGCQTKTQVTPSFREGVRVEELIEKIRKSETV